MAEHLLPGVEQMAEGSVRRLEVGGRTLAVVRSRGAIYVLDDRCPHAGGPLGEGSLEEGALRCPWHARRFELGSGRCLTHPATRAPACFPVRMEGGITWLTLPD